MLTVTYSIYTLQLKNPVIGNPRRIDYNTVFNTNRGGELLATRPAGRPKVNSYEYDFVGLRLAKVDEVISFFETSAAQEVTVTDHQGYSYFGVMVKPIVDRVTVKDVCSYTLSLEFLETSIAPSPSVSPSSSIVLFGGSPSASPSPWINAKSFLFDGVDEYVDMGNVLNATANFSFFAWVKWSGTGTQVILSKYRSLGNLRSYWMGFQNDGTIRVIISNNGSYNGVAKDYATTSTVGGDGNWHLVGFVFSADDLDISLDGVEQVSYNKNNDFTVNTIFAGTAELQFGIALGGNYFTGNLEGPVVFNKRLSLAEQLELYGIGKAIDIAGFSAYGNGLGWWRMGDDTLDNATGGTGNVQDQIGTNHGTPINTEVGDIVSDVP